MRIFAIAACALLALAFTPPQQADAITSCAFDHYVSGSGTYTWMAGHHRCWNLSENIANLHGFNISTVGFNDCYDYSIGDHLDCAAPTGPGYCPSEGEVLVDWYSAGYPSFFISDYDDAASCDPGIGDPTDPDPPE